MRIHGQSKLEDFDRGSGQSKMRMYGEYTADHFRKARDYDIEVFGLGSVAGYTRTGSTLVFRVSGVCYQYTQKDCDGELRPFMERLPDRQFTVTVRLQVCSDRVFRVTAGMGESVPDHNTVLVEREFADGCKGCPFTIAETDREVVIETSSARVIVEKSNWRMSMTDLSGMTVFAQYDDKILNFAYESLPFGFAHNPHTGETVSAECIRMEADESFFGFGQQFTPVNKRLQEVDVWATDPLSVGSPRTYLSLPFFMSSKGYGVFVNTHYRSKFFMGNQSNRACSFHVSEDVADYFLICGPSFRSILNSYTDITGKSPMVPKWSFGFWMSRLAYRTQEQVEEVARALREHEIPCDVINIDADWFDTFAACDWKFNRERFPDPAVMAENVGRLGFKLSIWQKPYITVEALPELTEFLLEKGWIPLTKNRELPRANPVFDISNPEAVAWYKEVLRDLFDLGIKVIKTDMGEGVPPEAVYHGYDGYEMRNIYSYLYNKAAYEVTEECTGEGLVWGRCGYAGSQKYPLVWGGDPTSDFDGLRFSIRGGLSLGLSGFTFWSHDIGGFLGRPTPKLYVRWAQAGFFTSHSRAHGAGNPREPWTFGEEAERIVREYARLRYRLIPYIYSMAYDSCMHGLPMMRHLILDFQDDPAVYHIDDEYMFGDGFLVAPILSEEDRRKVYLPEGEWVDYWDDRVYRGSQWLDYDAPLDRLPLFVRNGSIVPTGEEREFIDDSPVDCLTINVYVKDGMSSSFVYYDGVEHEITAEASAGCVRIGLPVLQSDVVVNLIGCESVESVLLDGVPVREYRTTGRGAVIARGRRAGLLEIRS